MKKFILLGLAVLLIMAMFTACMRNGNVSSNAGSNSGNNSHSSFGDSPGNSPGGSTGVSIDETSLPSQDNSTSGIENNNSGGLISKIEDMLYDINPFKTAYKDAGFDVSDGTNENNIRISKSGVDAAYDIYRFESSKEAEEKLKSYKSDTREAERRGNIIIVYEKGNEFHEDYMLPFNKVK